VLKSLYFKFYPEYFSKTVWISSQRKYIEKYIIMIYFTAF